MRAAVAAAAAVAEEEEAEAAEAGVRRVLRAEDPNLPVVHGLRAAVRAPPEEVQNPRAATLRVHPVAVHHVLREEVEVFLVLREVIFQNPRVVPSQVVDACRLLHRNGLQAAVVLLQEMAAPHSFRLPVDPTSATSRRNFHPDPAQAAASRIDQETNRRNYRRDPALEAASPTVPATNLRNFPRDLALEAALPIAQAPAPGPVNDPRKVTSEIFWASLVARHWAVRSAEHSTRSSLRSCSSRSPSTSW